MSTISVCYVGAEEADDNRRFLQSVAQQTVNDFQLVIWGSLGADNCATLSDELDGRGVLVLQQAGHGVDRRTWVVQGMSVVDTPMLLFAEAGVSLHRQLLREYMSAFENFRHTAAVFSNYRLGGTDRTSVPVRLPDALHSLASAPVRGYRREAITRVGGVDLLRQGGDEQQLLEALRERYRIDILQQFLYTLTRDN